MSLALVVETLAVLVDDDAIVIALDDSIRLSSLCINELRMDAIKGTSYVSADCKNYVEALALIVL